MSEAPQVKRRLSALTVSPCTISTTNPGGLRSPCEALGKGGDEFHYFCHGLGGLVASERQSGMLELCRNYAGAMLEFLDPYQKRPRLEEYLCFAIGILTNITYKYYEINDKAHLDH